jgi:DNA modification methylase
MLRASNVKPKDLYGMPWRVAFALQKDGWYLRQDIIWSKPNPMPESVTDRCTKSHEYLFLLTKSRRYHFNADAIREPLSEASVVRLSQAGLLDQAGSDRAVGKTNGTMKAVARGSSDRFPSGWNHGEDRSDNLIGRFTHKPRTSGNLERKHRQDYGGPLDNGQRQAFGVPWVDSGVGRNKRSVWSIATQPFKEAHFATMPPALVEPCILAGTEPGDLVLDPFSGSGTVGLVADRLGRDYLGIDLNPKFTAIAHARISSEAPLFHQPEPPACD